MFCNCVSVILLNVVPTIITLPASMFVCYYIVSCIASSFTLLFNFSLSSSYMSLYLFIICILISSLIMCYYVFNYYLLISSSNVYLFTYLNFYYIVMYWFSPAHITSILFISDALYVLTRHIASNIYSTALKFTF